MNFQAQLEKQLGFLETSCREYDAGNVTEAFRIATALRVIFHQTGASTSLLQHLQSTTIELKSTWESIAKDNTPIPGLTNMQLVLAPLDFRCVPKLDSHGRFVPREFWWPGETIYRRGTNNFKRRDFVQFGANKDGGAHVPTTYPPDYQEILDGMTWSINWPNPDGSVRVATLEHGLVASLRQMAFEALHSPQLLALAGR